MLPPSLIDLAARRPIRGVDDSAEFVRSAIEHRMDGLVWSAAVKDHSLLDAAARSTLAERSLGRRARQRELWSALTHCTDALTKLGVDVATFKGVTAEARWYADEGERPCADVDLLVAPHHRDRIDDVVAALQPSHPLAGSVCELVAKGQLQSIELRVQDVPVDVHLDLFKLGIPSRQTAAIWSRTLLLDTDQGAFRVLDPETALVQFLVHLNKDRFRWLLGFADISRLLAGEQIDWDLVASIMAADGMTTPLVLALDCVTTTLEIEPAPLALPRGARAAVWRRLWAPSVRLRGDAGLHSHHLRQAAIPAMASGRQRDALGLLARRLFPPRALVAYRNPDASSYVRAITVGRLGRTRARRHAARELARE